MWGEVPLTTSEKKKFSPGQFLKFQFSRHTKPRVSGKLVSLGPRNTWAWFPGWSRPFFFAVLDCSVLAESEHPAQ